MIRSRDERAADENAVAEFLSAAVVNAAKRRGLARRLPRATVRLYEKRFRFRFLAVHNDTASIISEAMRGIGVCVDRCFSPTRNQRPRGFTIVKGRLGKRFVRAVLEASKA